MKRFFSLALSISLIFTACFAGMTTVQATNTSTANLIADGGFDTTETISAYKQSSTDVWQKDSSDTANILTEADTQNKYVEFSGNGLWYIIGSNLEQGKTYRLSFQLKKNAADNSNAFEVYLCSYNDRYINSKTIMTVLSSERNSKLTDEAGWVTFYCDFTYNTGDDFFKYNTLRFYQYGATYSIDNIALTENTYGLIEDGGIDFTTELKACSSSSVDVWGYGYTWAPELSNEGDNKVIRMYGANDRNDMLTYVLGDKIKVGSKYQLTFKMKSASTEKPVQFYLVSASDVTYTQADAQTNFYPTSTDWETCSHTFTVTDSACNTLRFQTSTGYEHLLDDISLVEIVEESANREQIVDGTFDLTTEILAHSSSKTDVWTYGSSNMIPVLTTETGNTNKVVNLNKTNTATSSNALLTYNLGNKLKEGTEYQLSFKIKTATQGKSVALYLVTASNIWTDSIVGAPSFTPTKADEWQTMTYNFTVTDATYNLIRLQSNSDADIFIDDVSLVDTSIAVKHTVTAWTNNTYYGDATGDGEFSEGEVVNLNAVPTKNGKFVGWYDAENKLISSDSSYMFVPESDLDIFAKFSNVSSAEKNNPRTAVGNFRSNAIRAVAGNQALRFKYTVEQTVLDTDYNGYKIVEYGYIAANTDSILENGDSALTLESNYVSGAAYVRDYSGAVSKDVYFDKDDEAGTKTVSVALKNIGYNKLTKEINYDYYSKDYVVRSYVKYQNSEGEVTVIYGVQYVASVFDTMKTILSITETDATNNGYDWAEVQADQASVNTLLQSDEDMQSAYNSYASQN